VRTTCLVCFISTVNGRNNKKKKKKRKEEVYPWKAGTGSRHITNLKQSIFDIYGENASLRIARISLKRSHRNLINTESSWVLVHILVAKTVVLLSGAKTGAP
jgi:hypothetical protein